MLACERTPGSSLGSRVRVFSAGKMEQMSFVRGKKNVGF